MREDGESDLEFFNRLHREQRTERLRALTDAKAKAAADGKEPFDVDKLWALWDFSPQLSDADWKPDAASIEGLEEKYYVHHPQFDTLADFAKLMNELDPYR